MGFRVRRGNVTYRSEDRGFREIGSSPAMGAEMLSMAQRIAGNAEAVGSGDYETDSATVTAGWQNERRRGAVVRESRHEWRDWRDAILVRVLASMTIARARPRRRPSETSRAESDMVTYTRRDGTQRQATQAQANAWMNSRTGT